MQKNVEKMSFYYSPNFNVQKRQPSKIKYIILHYTGMVSDLSAIKKLCSSKSKVSCHYYVKKNGEIINIVPDLYTSWHAGISSWKKDNFLNSKSIGIEISNPGHEHGYKNFPKIQIKSLVKLIKKLKKKFKINNRHILGHSDIAPFRKKDPGEKFPWKFLSKNKISYWHKLSKIDCKKFRNKKFKNKDLFFNLLFNFGYMRTTIPKEKNKLVKNFQRRFRPDLINGIIDKECYEILKSLL